MNRFAFIDSKRRLGIFQNTPRILGGQPDGLPWAQWHPSSQESSAWSWPTWSPEGSHIACFRIGPPFFIDDADNKSHSPVDRRGTYVHMINIDESFGIEAANLDSRLPVYSQWSPDGTHVAVLSQRGARLVLSIIPSKDDDPSERILDEGSPLFFTWTPMNSLLAYVGSIDSSSGGRMVIHDPNRRGWSDCLPGTPGNFCAPIAWDSYAAYVGHHEGRTGIFQLNLHNHELQLLAETQGLVALVRSPDRRYLAYGVAPGGDGTPYRTLSLIHLETHERIELVQRDYLSFMWASQALLVCHVDTQRNFLVWERVEFSGTSHRLVELRPTRDMGFYLRFFEQYSQSHSIVDDDSLLLAGSIHGRMDIDAPPRIWRIGLENERCDDLMEGMFAVFEPSKEAL